MRVGTDFPWQGLDGPCWAVGAAGSTENLSAVEALSGQRVLACAAVESGLLPHPEHHLVLHHWCLQGLAPLGNSSAVLDKQKEQGSLSSLGTTPARLWRGWHKAEPQTKTAAWPGCSKVGCDGDVQCQPPWALPARDGNGCTVCLRYTGCLHTLQRRVVWKGSR